MSYATIEHYFEESLKYESTKNYSSSLECCQKALLFIEQILNLNDANNNGIAIYARTKKNSLLLRIRSLEKRQIEEQEKPTRPYRSTTSLTSTFKPMEKSLKNNENFYDNNLSKVTSILSTSKISRPKKNVKFSDNVALIVPTSDDNEELPSEHLIHSFLRKIQQQQIITTPASAASDSDSDTPSSSSSNDIPIGLSECTLCHKRCLKSNQIGTLCSNCHFYMQRFQPTTPS